MKLHSLFILGLISLLTISCSKDGEPNPSPEENLYFPPINSDTWETISPTDLGWNTNELQPLLDYLEEKNSKSFKELFKKFLIENARFTRWVLRVMKN